MHCGTRMEHTSFGNSPKAIKGGGTFKWGGAVGLQRPPKSKLKKKLCSHDDNH